ncbi:hypothetical protein H0X10_00765 [Candidatus Saccharibacteria bacterium]|nr:hypothetical protein [Candidatus Saccharibacteria bacterium]
MEIFGDKAYLTVHEQRRSGYDSPIDMNEFDLHQERLAADTELDRLASIQTEDNITAGRIITDLAGAQIRSNIARAIGRELATRTAIVTMFDEVVQELGERDS